jgi:hypothetical protein
MSLRRYVASGRGGTLALGAVLGAALAGGLLTGLIEGVVHRWFSLFLLFPMFIGLGAGGGAMWMVGRQQLRAPLLALVLGFAGGAAGYLATHAVDYLRFRAAVAADVHRENPAATEDELATAIDDMLVHTTGASGVRGYLELAAQNGVSIKRMGASDKGLALTGIGAWIVWLCELLVAAGTAGFLARSRAREPFCESCDVWYGPATQIATGGAGDKAARTRLIEALDAGDLDRAAGVIAEARGPRTSFVLSASTCPGCGAESYCELKRATLKKSSHLQISTLEAWLMTKDERAALVDALARARAHPVRT